MSSKSLVFRIYLPNKLWTISRGKFTQSSIPGMMMLITIKHNKLRSRSYFSNLKKNSKQRSSDEPACSRPATKIVHASRNSNAQFKCPTAQQCPHTHDPFIARNLHCGAGKSGHLNRPLTFRIVCVNVTCTHRTEPNRRIWQTEKGTAHLHYCYVRLMIA